MASEHISVSSGSASGGAGAAVERAGAVSGVSGAAVGEAGAVSGVSGAAAREAGAVSGVSGAAVGEAGAMSGVSGAAVGEAGAMSGVSGAAVGEAGAMSGVSGAAVGEAGAMSGVSGAAVGEAGAAVEAPGAASDVLGDVSDVLLEGVQAAALDALLAHASTPPPPVGLEERVLEAIRREESSLPASIRGSLATPPLRPTPWYARRRVWFSSAAAACLFAALLPFLPLGEENRTGESLAIDDAILVDDALDLIADEELITAICSVSTGKDSFMSNQ